MFDSGMKGSDRKVPTSCVNLRFLIGGTLTHSARWIICDATCIDSTIIATASDLHRVRACNLPKRGPAAHGAQQDRNVEGAHSLSLFVMRIGSRACRSVLE